ncbi:OmpP1/FadL family transporter [Flexibacterium corallicola]|uniref:OmpP1/FadL family transporter n=1 Tax=Flexibacterium corallicola TaxID=3037259 RepID=UPI00286EC35F|nr:outer membrane protein transport protein [Pseudovibrio sp. M1P-2-3]
MHKFNSSIQFAAILGTALAPVSALATGWDTTGIGSYDLLFSPKKVVVEGQATYVNVNVDYKNVKGTSQAGAARDQYFGAKTTQGSSGAIPDVDLYSLAAKVRLGNSIDCLGQLHTPISTHESPGETWGGRYAVAETDASTTTFDATCSYKFNINENSSLRLIGGFGVSTVDFYTSSMQIIPILGNPPAVPPSYLDAKTEVSMTEDGYGFGWRAGVGYEMPSIALRAYAIYNAEVEGDLEGDFLLSHDSAFNHQLDPTNTVGAKARATTTVTLPQSIEFGIRSGIAPNWLVSIGAKWTDWSIMEDLVVSFDKVEDITGKLNNGDKTKRILGYSDGWAVEGTVAHMVNEDLIVAASLKWDQGVGEIYSDTYQFGLGGSYQISEHSKVSLGGRAIYKTAGEGLYQSEDSAATGHYEYGDSWNFAVSSRLTFEF